MLRDVNGNDLEEGDEIEVGDYIEELDSWIYLTGPYTVVDSVPLCQDRTLYIYDYIRILKPIRERKLYGYPRRD
jgi:hypothetical protein